jgi:aspartyl-tRNA(Asn)/glutamyl-tRNA(Gln) amidotransferase subunit C
MISAAQREGAITPLCYNSLAMDLTAEEVRKIAFLARLRLTAEEVETYARQLSAILDYAAQLQEIDTESIPPTATVLPLIAPLREDKIRPSVPQDEILANASSAEEGMFRVAPVLEQEA